MGDTYGIDYPRGHAGTGSAAIRRAQRALRPALAPASWVYGCLSDTVRRIRSLDETPTPESVTVISVGGVEFGGSGKTPLCLHLMEQLRADGESLAYVSRGYRSRSERFDGVSVVAEADGHVESGVRWLRPQSGGLAREIGDEGAMVARRLPGVPLAFGRDKARAVGVVSRWVEGGFVVLDDAFQSWGVARDVDVVIVGANALAKRNWLLPAGTLREEYTALERADVVLFDGAASRAELDQAARTLSSCISPEAVVGGIVRSIEFTDAAGNETATPEGAVVVSSIARPESFEASLTDAGLHIVKALRYPDHHAYSREDVEAIREACATSTLVTTEKDWAKLVDLNMRGSDVCLARLRLRLVGEGVYGQITKPRA